MNNNSAKSLHEIVSVDAWHAQFDSEKRASVHVDLSFSTGEMGTEEVSQVTFKLSIKKATLKIVIPATEGVAVVQSSVDREPTLEGVRKVIEESKITNSGSAAIDARLKMPIGVTASGEVKASRSGSNARATSTEFTSQISEFEVRQIVDAARNYGWEIKTSSGGALVGKVWDPVKRPRLSIKKLSESRLEPGFQIQVVCRKCDLMIDDVKFKEGTPFFNGLKVNRMAAAKAFIRTRLIDDGLYDGKDDSDLVEFVIAEMAVVEEIK